MSAGFRPAINRRRQLRARMYGRLKFAAAHFGTATYCESDLAARTIAPVPLRCLRKGGGTHILLQGWWEGMRSHGLRGVLAVPRPRGATRSACPPCSKYSSGCNRYVRVPYVRGGSKETKRCVIAEQSERWFFVRLPVSSGARR